jgi:molecular chaperone GrpE
MAKNISKQIAEIKSGWQRTAADFENYKARVEREKPQWENEGKIKVLEELLPILDNLTLAIVHLPEDQKNNQWAQGIILIAKQIDERLAELGIEKIAPQKSDAFDHNLHEAVSTIADKNLKSGTIFELKHTGYRLGERVIRAAKVTVAE